MVAQHAHVTTVGYGPAPTGSDVHLRVPDDAPSLPQTVPGVLTLAARRWKAAELSAPAAASALQLAAGQRWDVVVANDARSLAVAFALADGAPVWADLHEWAPEERTHVLAWKVLVAPLMDHLCRTYLPRCAATTTVAESIAGLYSERYGVRPRVMRNSAPWLDLEPSSVGDPIRLVHSGGAVPGRNLEATIDTAAALSSSHSLDLYLVPANDGGRYLESLRERASGSQNIRFHDPVSPAELPSTLNAYDVGVFWIPPFNTNARYTLPNKLFDYVQARLAVAIGPTMEMERVVSAYALGVVSAGFTAETAAPSVASMTRADIEQFKEHAHAAARELSFDADAEVAHRILQELLTGRAA